MEEYRGMDAELYDAYTSVNWGGDIEFYVEEAVKAVGPVLELGCGTGRITIPVAEAGLEIVGLDNSEDMLNIARRKATNLGEDVRSRITLVRGDMRDFSLGRRFNLVMIPFRAFLHLLTVEEQKQALGCIRSHLTDEGRLVFNIFDPNLKIISDHDNYLGQALKRDSIFKHPETGNQVIEWESRWYILEEQLIDEVRIFEEFDGNGKTVSRHYIPSKLRFVYRYEMQNLLELCGYEIEALYGDFKRGGFRHGGEQVWVARKG